MLYIKNKNTIKIINLQFWYFFNNINNSRQYNTTTNIFNFENTNINLKLLNEIDIFSNMKINILNIDKNLGIKKVINENGNTIIDIKGTKIILSIGLSIFISKLLFIVIGKLAKKEIEEMINNLNKQFLLLYKLLNLIKKQLITKLYKNPVSQI